MDAQPFIVTNVSQGQAFMVARGAGFLDPAKAASECYTSIAHALARARMEIVHERIFGSLEAESEVRAARRSALSAKGLPHETATTYVQGNPPSGFGLAGVIIHAVAKTGALGEVSTIQDGNRPCGRAWKNNGVTYLVLQNIQRVDNSPGARDTKYSQTIRMIERASSILEKQGFSYRDVVRTRFYLSDIVDWYSEFNLARNAKYEELGVLTCSDGEQSRIPASTGIGGDNPNDSAGTLDLLAIRSASDRDQLIQSMNNPRQIAPLRYGSTFSRAILIKEPDVGLIQVSGTAAIDEEGKSLYPNDVRKQIINTLDNVEALVNQKGAKLSDIAAATVFVKRPEDIAAFWQIATERELEDMPAICVVADICRAELLFEIDAEVAFGRYVTNTAFGTKRGYNVAAT